MALYNHFSYNFYSKINPYIWTSKDRKVINCKQAKGNSMFCFAIFNINLRTSSWTHSSFCQQGLAGRGGMISGILSGIKFHMKWTWKSPWQVKLSHLTGISHLIWTGPYCLLHQSNLAPLLFCCELCKFHICQICSTTVGCQLNSFACKSMLTTPYLSFFLTSLKWVFILFCTWPMQFN